MEEDIINNTVKLLDSWSPHEGVEKLIYHFYKNVTYGSFANQEIANHTDVTYFLMILKKNGKYQRVRRSGGPRRRPEDMDSLQGFLKDGAPEIVSLQSRSVPIPILR